MHVDEAEWIKRHINSQRSLGSLAIKLSVDDEILLYRIQQRAKTQNRQETSDRVRNRLAIYRENIGRILDILDMSLISVIEVDATVDEDSVYKNISSKLEDLS